MQSNGTKSATKLSATARNKPKLWALCAFAVGANITYLSSMIPPAVSTELKATVHAGKRHWLFPNHPRLRRITKAVGFGATTGAIVGPILGVGMGTGMVVGAAEHGTLRGLKDHHDLKKHGHLDKHIW